MKILITGAGTGIGHDAAFALLKRGHEVIATTETEEQALALKKEAENMGVALQTGKLDIRKQEDVDRYKNTEIDVLINNAAIGESGPICEIPLDRFQNLLDINVVGTVRMTQAFAPMMAKRKSGRIIILSSIAGRFVVPFLGPYSMTKFALEAMGDSLRAELKPHGVHVSLIEPGLILTGFNERMAATKYEWLKPDSVMADRVEKTRKHDEDLPKHSHPTTPVVESIIHAVEAAKPKTRYITPSSYRPSVEFLRVTPDGMKDRAAIWAGGL